MAADSARATRPIAQSQRGDTESCEREMYNSVQHETVRGLSNVGGIEVGRAVRYQYSKVLYSHTASVSTVRCTVRLPILWSQDAGRKTRNVERITTAVLFLVWLRNKLQGRVESSRVKHWNKRQRCRDKMMMMTRRPGQGSLERHDHCIVDQPAGNTRISDHKRFQLLWL